MIPMLYRLSYLAICGEHQNRTESNFRRTSRLAGGPYRHQGLSSVVLIIGLEPITSDVSGRRSHQLSYMSGCGLGRTRTFNHSINSRGLYHWATSPNNLNVLPNYTKEGLEPPSPCRVVLPIKLLTDSNRHFSLVGADGIEPPSRCFTDTSRTLPILPFCTPYRIRTCDLLYVRQPLLPTELRVLVLVS